MTPTENPNSIFQATDSRWRTVIKRGLTFVKSERGREIAGAAFVIILASIMLRRCFGGDWPVNHDHPVHLFRIWQLKQHLLAHGTPWSWSQRWFAGCPISTVYPVGADFFVDGQINRHG